MSASPRKRQARYAQRQEREAGFTLLELLLALSLLAVLTVFLAGGLQTARHAFDTDRGRALESRTDAAIQAVSALIGSATPLRTAQQAQADQLIFDGKANSLKFVGLSEGRSLRGGFYQFSIRTSGHDITVQTAPVSTGAGRGPGHERSPPDVVVLRGVRAIGFRYFGKTSPLTAPAWRTEWIGQARLPDLVSIQIDFEDSRRNEPPTIIALRQG